jgi:hypothetical protein
MDFRNFLLCFVIGGFLALVMLADEARSQDCGVGKGNTPCNYSPDMADVIYDDSGKLRATIYPAVIRAQRDNWWWDNPTFVIIMVVAFLAIGWTISAVERQHSEHQRRRKVLRELFEGPGQLDSVVAMASCSYCGTGDISGDKCRCCGAPNPNLKGTISNPGEEKSRPSSGWNRPVPVG